MDCDNYIIEIGKMLADLLRLIATLSTGMIGLIITIVEKIFTPSRVFRSLLNIFLLSLTLIAFIASLVLSILGLIGIPDNVNEIISNASQVNWVPDYAFYGSIWSFVSGVVLFVVLSILSFLASGTSTATAGNPATEDDPTTADDPDVLAEQVDSEQEGPEIVNQETDNSGHEENEENSTAS